MTNKREWFGEWFDSRYYHVLYKHRDHEEARRFIDNLANRLQIKPHHKLMDLACGKGRHAIYLNKKGFDIVGLDLSYQNIEAAKRLENERLKFFVHDMRHKWADEAFDFIFNLFTSFGYFDTVRENQMVIDGVAAGLKKDGKFVLDFLNPYTVVHNLVGEEIKVVEGITFHINRWLSEDGYIVKKIEFEDKSKCYSFREKVKAIRRVEFMEYFRNAGLTVKELFGDYELSAYQPEYSERMIFYIEK